MARKKLTYTHEFPYHVFARSNNKEWFYLSKNQMWNVFVNELNQIVKKYKPQIHSFVLMDNHYHMLITTCKKYPLGKVMCELQKSVSRKVNYKTGRINHVFGGPYKPSLITDIDYYARVYKYVYRNPMAAKMCSKVEEYPYSTFLSDRIGVCSPFTGIASTIPSKNQRGWINTPETEEQDIATLKGLRRTSFKPIIIRK